MMTRTKLPVAALFVALALSGCAEIQTLGASAIEHRRVMNDLQARATMHATCDFSIGSYFRELNDLERRYVAAICGGPQLEIAK